MRSAVLTSALALAAAARPGVSFALDAKQGVDAGPRDFVAKYVVNGRQYDLRGHEPSSGTGHPVYMFVAGDQTRVTRYSSDLRFTREMAARGFVAALVEYPGMRYPQYRYPQDDVHHEPTVFNLNDEERTSAAEVARRDLTLTCSGKNNSLITVAREIFSYAGPGDTTSTSAVATLCRRNGVDCSAGVAIHGMSLGGLLSHYAPQFAPAVSASLVWSAGNFVPGVESCCSVTGNSSCCDEADGIIGGSSLDCMIDSVLSTFLPKSRRRLVIGAADLYYGTNDTTFGAIAQCKRGTGYDCGTRSDCIQADGSGYYVPSVDDVGGLLHASTGRLGMQGHAFYVDCRSNVYSEKHELNDDFLEAEEEWGLKRSFDWLARTARQSR